MFVQNFLFWKNKFIFFFIWNVTKLKRRIKCSNNSDQLRNNNLGKADPGLGWKFLANTSYFVRNFSHSDQLDERNYFLAKIIEFKNFVLRYEKILKLSIFQNSFHFLVKLKILIIFYIKTYFPTLLYWKLDRFVQKFHIRRRR